MEDVLNTIYQYLATYGLQVIAAILILVIGRWVAKIVTAVVGRLMTRAHVEATLTSFVKNLCFIGVMTFVIIAALNKLGIETASLAVVIGAAGLAIGFALQGTLSNFAAGIMLVIFKPFKVGDYVEAAGKAGTVKEIQIFNTILASPDNVRIIVPNSQVTGSNIMNYTTTGTRRLDMVVGISYESDLRKAKQLLQAIIAEDSRVLEDPAPVIAIAELADSSVDFVVRPWVKTSDYWALKFDLTEKIKLTFDDNGISIPYPQRTVHMATA